MTIKEIQAILKSHGISLSAVRIEENLKAYELKAEELTPEMVTGWAEELRQTETKPAKGKTGGLAKTAKSEAIAPNQQQEAIAKAEQSAIAPQNPTAAGEEVQEIFIEVPASAIAGVENLATGIVLQINSEVDAMATSVARFANNAEALFAHKLNQKIGMKSGTSATESLSIHGNAWGTSRGRLGDLIKNLQQDAIAS